VKLVLGFAAMFFVGAIWSATAQQPADGPAYSPAGELLRPQNYREWVFLSSGLGMTYGPAQPAANQPQRFDNVFTTRAAYRAFRETGKWPEQTMFILEVRNGDVNVSINNGGRTQGDLVALEAAVKDSTRYAATGGWGYFSFDGERGLADSTTALPSTRSCYTCHSTNTAVENTFVQFYPELFAVAKQKGTVKATYDPNHKP
jgi:hypothetical protein